MLKEYLNFKSRPYMAGMKVVEICNENSLWLDFHENLKKKKIPKKNLLQYINMKIGQKA